MTAVTGKFKKDSKHVLLPARAKHAAARRAGKYQGPPRNRTQRRSFTNGTQILPCPQEELRVLFSKEYFTPSGKFTGKVLGCQCKIQSLEI